MLMAAELVDQNQCWLPRALRRVWKSDRAHVRTKILHVRPDCRLMFIDIVTSIGDIAEVTWVYRLASTVDHTTGQLASTVDHTTGQLASASEDLQSAMFLYALPLSYTLHKRLPLETPNYWVWAAGVKAWHVIVLCKRTLEIHNVRLPFEVSGWLGNTIYQSRDTLVLIMDEADQCRIANDTDDAEEVLDVMTERCERSLSQGRKSLLPRDAEPWSCHSPNLCLVDYGVECQSRCSANSTFNVYEADIVALLSVRSRVEQRAVLRCLATGVEHHELPRILLDLPGTTGLACPPCWPFVDGQNESAARLFPVPDTGFLQQTYDGSPMTKWILQTEHLLVVEAWLTLCDRPDRSTSTLIIIERCTGRCLHVFPNAHYKFHSHGYLSLIGGVLYNHCAVTPPAELDIIWLDGVEQLRQHVMMDATPLPQDLVDLVIDHIDGGFWRHHVAALASS
jgi:hypothetical protein